MSLPNLAALRLEPSIHEQWCEACGERPSWRSWKNVRGKQKYALLHDVAMAADEDNVEGGGYLSVYEQLDIDDIMATNKWSVEHVIPRKHIHGSAPGPAENDPLGWEEATRLANSRRSNTPLYLWLDSDGTMAPPKTVVVVDGEAHYVPPAAQRARLARKWMFLRASYEGIDPPSAAQRRHAADVVALAKTYPIQPAERRVNDHFRKTYNYANPLLEDGADRFYDSVEWRHTVFA